MSRVRWTDRARMAGAVVYVVAFFGLMCVLAQLTAAQR